MADLYTLSFEDILDYLVELGKRLAFDQNQHVREAFRLSCITSGLSESILRFHYSHLGAMFDRTEMRRMMERACGVEYLEGWVDQGTDAFPGLKARTRAFGERGVQVVAARPSISGILPCIRKLIPRSSHTNNHPPTQPTHNSAC